MFLEDKPLVLQHHPKYTKKHHQANRANIRASQYQQVGVELVLVLFIDIYRRYHHVYPRYC
jgi:hypothetical protein